MSAKRLDAHASRLAATIGRLLGRLLGRRAQGSQGERQSSEIVARSANTSQEQLSTALYVHDMRNQLQVILVHADGMAQQLPKGTSDTEYRELLRATEHASQLTRLLLLAGHPGSAKRGHVDVNQVVRELAETVGRLVGPVVRVNLRLSVEPSTVVAEAYEVERILLNLVLNARDAMRDGGTLTVETMVIRPGSPTTPGSSAADSVNVVRLRVSDTGHGMTPEVTARITESFFTTRKMGTGLGLSSVARTVRDLEGTMTIESQPNVGTRVTIQLPLAAISDADALGASRVF